MTSSNTPTSTQVRLKLDSRHEQSKYRDVTLFDAPADLTQMHGAIITGYLAGLGFLEDLIMRGEPDAVLSRGLLGTWSAWATGIYDTGFAPHAPDAQHLHGSNSSNVHYILSM